MSRKILIVDDEDKIRDMVANYLAQEGYRVVEAADGEQALRVLRQEQPDLVVLDWMLPGKSGLELCKTIRGQGGTAVIMLTAKTEEVDKLLGLELGADDYVTKPFSLRELAARIKAVLRRVSGGDVHHHETIRIRDMEIDLDGREVKVKGQKIDLTPTEFKILSVLAATPGRVYSRLQLLDAVFGYAYEGYERSIDTHVSNLRKKIEPDPSSPEYITTVYGTGYRLRQ
ncbi:MAG: response regulator transcription factor [Firmicutes bacterium]|nr:response regulator transcription factor [Bacillota bacterium]